MELWRIWILEKYHIWNAYYVLLKSRWKQKKQLKKQHSLLNNFMWNNTLNIIENKYAFKYSSAGQEFYNTW